MAARKLAISVDESLAGRADRWARKCKLSRSELYSTAVREYLQRQDAQAIREQLDRVYTDPAAAEDGVDFVKAAAELRLEDASW